MKEPGPSFLDAINVKIIEELYRHGARNLSMIARRIGVPRRTVHQRFTKLRSQGLRVRAAPRYGEMGMLFAVAMISVPIGGLRRTISHLSSLPYLHTLFVSHGAVEGVVAFVAAPIGEVEDVREGIASVCREVSGTCEVVFSGGPYPLVPCFECYDVRDKVWHIRCEVDYEEDESISRALNDPLGQPRKVDAVDIFIISRLHRDGTVKMSRLSSELGVSKVLLKYHYDRHVVNLLFDRYQVEFKRFACDHSMLLLLDVEVEDRGGMVELASMISRTPFPLSVMKVIRENRLLFLLEATAPAVENGIYRMLEEGAERLGITSHRLSIVREVTRGNPFEAVLRSARTP